jgi:hypothetical protein
VTLSPVFSPTSSQCSHIPTNSSRCYLSRWSAPDWGPFSPKRRRPLTDTFTSTLTH